MERRTVNKKYPFDNRVFEYGEIYNIKDEYVVFPESRYVTRTKHDSRSVCIIHHCKANSEAKSWVINVAPITSNLSLKRDTDLEIIPQDGNYIDRKSLLRLGTAQPVLKIDLVGPVGRLTEDQMMELSALQISLAGVDLSS